MQHYKLDLHNYLLQMSKATVGKTRKLKIKISEQLSNICKNTNTIIGLYFNTTGHTFEHIQVNTIEKLHKSSNYQKVKELIWINKLQILKYDLNKKDYS